jgi:helicase
MPQETFSEIINDEWISGRLKEWGIEALTDIQSKAVQAGLLDGESLVVSAPTSSGKTLIAEIASLVALKSNLRVLYLVSHRALADQKYSDFEARFGSKSAKPISTVGLSTGDRSEGDVDAQIRVATYEKAIGLIMVGQVYPENTVVIADELQILCDPSRGPEIEALCAIFRQRSVKQFIALTATVQNPEDLADWMRCKLVQSSVRGTPLYQEIWFGAVAHLTTFGEAAVTRQPCAVANNDLTSTLSNLLERGLGPILVFTETKREASSWATDFIRTRPRTALGIELSDQLELFSEPTDSSEKLRTSAERRVAFHTADLSAQERQVLEDAFAKSSFEVCFATSTLAAGVNFPFRTIVFPKLSFRHREVGARLGLADYRNMSGRAGRLRLHENGYSILLARDASEFAHAEKLVGPKNEKLESVMLRISIRKTLLSLVVSRIAISNAAIDVFFQNTLYWHQVGQKTERMQVALQNKSREAVVWLIANGLVEEDGDSLRTTQLGRAAAISGLLPETAVQFHSMLIANRDLLESAFDELACGLVYACCASGEFRANPAPRFLPFISTASFGGADFWTSRKLPIPFNRADGQLHQCAQAIALYMTGLAERKIAFATGLSAGAIQHTASDVAWILEGLQRISSIPELGLSQSVSNHIGQLSRRVRWGVPPESLDLLRVAEKHRVPGLGRQRTMELVSRGYATLQDLIGAGKEKLLAVLKSPFRVEALLNGAAVTTGHGGVCLEASHIQIAHTLGVGEIVERCYGTLGVDYEKAILELLEACEHMDAKPVDNGVRQNVPDLLIVHQDFQILLECKTSSKSHGIISKEDAWAVIQKSEGFDDQMARVTLGKSCFDEISKQKAALSRNLSLVENEAFLEAILRLLLKEITTESFMKWLMAPGVADLDRLPGRYAYSLR